jgi:hypothetical protein
VEPLAIVDYVDEAANPKARIIDIAIGAGVDLPLSSRSS